MGGLGPAASAIGLALTDSRLVATIFGFIFTGGHNLIGEAGFETELAAATTAGTASGSRSGYGGGGNRNWGRGLGAGSKGN